MILAVMDHSQADQELAALPVEETARCVAYMDIIAAAAKALASVKSLAAEEAARQR